MRVAALPKPFYRAAAHEAAALSDCANARLRDLRRWWNLRESGHTATEAASLLEIPRATLTERPHQWLGG